MLFKNSLKAYEIQQFCAETLNESASFQAFVLSKTNAPFNYEMDSRVDEDAELPSLPYCCFFAGEQNEDMRQPEWGQTYDIGILFGITDNKTPEVVNGIKRYKEPIWLQKIAQEAVDTIQTTIRQVGIEGNYEMSIIGASGNTTPTGEDDDIQYRLALTFSNLQDITN